MSLAKPLVMGGVNANGNPIRPKRNSLRPSNIIFSAWDFTPEQKQQVESKLEGLRTRLKAEIADLESQAANLKGNIAIAICKGSGSTVIPNLNAFIATFQHKQIDHARSPHTNQTSDKFTGDDSPTSSGGQGLSQGFASSRGQGLSQGFASQTFQGLGGILNSNIMDRSCIDELVSNVIP